MNISENWLIKYILRVAIAISVLLNVILGGSSNQTLSARNYHWKRINRPNAVWLINHLVFWDEDHCMMSWLFWYTKKNIRNSGKVYVQLESDVVEYKHLLE
jgi:hypothetical protein